MCQRYNRKCSGRQADESAKHSHTLALALIQLADTHRRLWIQNTHTHTASQAFQINRIQMNIDVITARLGTNPVQSITAPCRVCVCMGVCEPVCKPWCMNGRCDYIFLCCCAPLPLPPVASSSGWVYDELTYATRTRAHKSVAVVCVCACVRVCVLVTVFGIQTVL